MALALAMLEGGSLFGAVCASVLLVSHPDLTSWAAVAGVLAQSLVLSLCCFTTFYLNDLYDLRIVGSFAEFTPRLVQSVGIAFIAVAVPYALLPSTVVSERALVTSLVLVVGLVVAVRAVSYGIMRCEPFAERVLIVGASPLTSKLVEEVRFQPHRGYTVVAVADDASAADLVPSACSLMGPLSHLDKIIEEVRPDRIVVGLTERRGRLPVRQLLESRVRGIPVEDGIRVYERLTGKLAIESLTPSVLIFSSDFRKSRLDTVGARMMGLIVSVVGLIGLSPLFALISLLIKLDSRGPVFFVQDRVGLHGRRFRLIKFRTMHPVSGPTSEWVRDNADRITRVGKYLRRFRLDELPQFVNILRGEMNLVGPRPHPVSNYELFCEKIPYYSLRALVRPGVTGWAQVRYAYANDLQEEIEKMRYDLFYIKHCSLWVDLRVIFETAKIVLFGRESTP